MVESWDVEPTLVLRYDNSVETQVRHFASSDSNDMVTNKIKHEMGYLRFNQKDSVMVNVKKIQGRVFIVLDRERLCLACLLAIFLVDSQRYLFLIPYGTIHDDICDSEKVFQFSLYWLCFM